MKRFRSIICSVIVSVSIVFSQTVFASESIVPVDSKIIGEWIFTFGGDITHVSIFEHDGVDFLYQKFPDGSGDPVKVRIENTKNGRVVSEDESSEFWLLQEDGSLELHDKKGLVPGWQAKSASELADAKLTCKIVEVKRSENLQLDDENEINNLKSVEIKVISNFKQKRQFIGAAKNVVNTIAASADFDQAVIWFYKADTESAATLKDHEFYVAYTPDPSKLVYREKVWETMNPKDSELFDEADEFVICMQ